jgi:NAD(P)-dependent dehydrogenase (short-subunit alcohol dehydrogenase family)
MGILEGQRAVVTGGSRGLGRGIAVAFAKAGADVAVIYRKRADEARAVIAEIETAGRRGWAYQADVAQWDEVSAATEAAANDMGGIDIVVANAAVANPFVSLVDTPVERWRKIMSVNLDGAFYTVKAAMPRLLAQGRGTALLITSPGGEKAAPQQGTYGASKAAMYNLIATWAKEVAPQGVRVLGLSPGVFVTDMTENVRKVPAAERVPLGRFGEPEELGRIAAFLCSSDASYLTGITIRADGGMTA